jgi:NAD+ kinase
MEIKRIGIVTKNTPYADEVAESIVRRIEGRKDLNMIRGEVSDVDLIVCVGGDGTILRLLQSMKDNNIPILGINLGEIGFLADVSKEEAVYAIEHAINEGFEVEDRARLSVHINGKKLPYAMNEVVLTSSLPVKMVSLKIFVNENEFETLRADGVIFATPTGSTAYALSSGGPIVDPEVDAIIIIPLAPFKLSARSSVVPASSSINVRLLNPKDATIVIDGQYSMPVSKEDVITITKSDKPAFFVKTELTFFSKVRKKLIERV